MLSLHLKTLGFNYNFNALSGDPEKNELMKAFSTIFKAGQKLSFIPVLRAMSPAFRFLVRISIVASPCLSSNLQLDYSRHRMTLHRAKLLL